MTCPLQEARKYFAKALKINNASLGSEHTSTTRAAQNLAACDAALGVKAADGAEPEGSSDAAQ